LNSLADSVEKTAFVTVNINKVLGRIRAVLLGLEVNHKRSTCVPGFDLVICQEVLYEDRSCPQDADGMIEDILAVLKHIGAIGKVNTLVNLTRCPFPF
jgi:hypothetical protein